ncbi:MAG: hypothetical protein Q7K43_01285, partial [Candidatus Woesearchaeota archaeon]|nr:hypothetical protein [Candidatus Woesearchaeota archaeon]
ELESSSLSIYEQEDTITVDEDESETAHISFTIPSNARGTHDLIARVYADNGDITDEETLQLEISCGATPQTGTVPQTTLNPGNNAPSAGSLGGSLIYAQPTAVEESSFRTSNLYMPFLVFMILLAGLVILLLLGRR